MSKKNPVDKLAPFRTGGISREILSSIEEVDRGIRYDATCTILGTPHHVTLVRVTSKPTAHQRAQGRYEGQYPHPDSHQNYYDHLTQIDPGGNFQTVKLPGKQGEFVCIITPFHK